MPDVILEKKEEEPPDKKKLKKVEITGQVRKNGYYIGVKIGRQQKKLEINFPQHVWSRYPKKLKQLLLDNLVFVATYHIPLMKGAPLRMEYSTCYPQISAPLLKSVALSIPFYTFVKKETTREKILKILLNTDHHFNKFINRDGYTSFKAFKSYSNRVIVPFTFGKDSLLTTALCDTLKIKPQLIFVEESEELFEIKQKKRIRRRFEKEFGKTIEFLKNPLDSLREGGVDGWYGWEFQLTCIVLLLIPFAYAYKARYILFSNEKSCDNFTYDNDGYKYYPDLEQSKEWTRELSLISESLTGGNVQVRNFLEPLEDTAIIRILHRLFPTYAKYQSSCFNDNPRSKDHRWCGRCSKCARIFIMLKAAKIDPRNVGFDENLMKNKYKYLYSAFGKQKTYDSAYEMSRVGQLEELYSFMQAYENGSKGDLITLFKKQYYSIMKPLQEKMTRAYLSLYTFDMVPQKYRRALRKLFLKGIHK